MDTNSGAIAQMMGLPSWVFDGILLPVLVVAVLFVLANLLADLTYTYLDPQIQLDKVRG